MIVTYKINNKVPEVNFEKIVYQWLSEGDYTPDDIIENIITTQNLVQVPIIYYKNDYAGTCSASLGYNRTEYYQVWNESLKRNETKSRVVTDWRPHAQQVQGTLVTLVYAGDAYLEGIAEFIENMGWRGEDLVVIDTNSKDFAYYNALFSASPANLWASTGVKKAYNTAVQQTVPMLPSKLIQNLSLNIKFAEKNSFRVIAPYWIFQYEYEGKDYYVALDGNDTSRVEGTKPEDTKRKARVRMLRWLGWLGGGLAAFFAVYLYSGKTMDELKFSWENFGIFAVVFLVSLWAVESEVKSIKENSSKKRKSSLTKKLN